jgi:hypothetical protein
MRFLMIRSFIGAVTVSCSGMVASSLDSSALDSFDDDQSDDSAAVADGFAVAGAANVSDILGAGSYGEHIAFDAPPATLDAMASIAGKTLGLRRIRIAIDVPQLQEPNNGTIHPEYLDHVVRAAYRVR